MASARVRRSEASRNAAPLLVDNRGILTTKSKSPVRCRNAETELFHFHLRGLPSFPLPNEKMFFFSLSLSLRENCQPMREISKSTRAKAEPKIKRGRERERERVERSRRVYKRRVPLLLFFTFFLSSKERNWPSDDSPLPVSVSSLERAERRRKRKGTTHPEKKIQLARGFGRIYARSLLTKTVYTPASFFINKPRLSLSLSLLDPGRDLLSF